MPTTNATTVDFGRFQLEKHVDLALRTARDLARDQAVNARHALEAALIISRSSPAFSKLKELLPIYTAEIPPGSSAHDDQTSLGGLTMVFSAKLAESFAIAEPFFEKSEKIWGRDYITLAMLAVNDETLKDLTRAAGTTPQNLQDAWFEFVTSTEQHRSRDEWEMWWREAGVPTPATDGPTYLLTWNPKRFPKDRIEKTIEEIAQKGSGELPWSIGNRRSVPSAARVFLMRQGVEPRGLVGEGEVAGDIYEGPSYLEEEAKQGAKTWYVPVRWHRLHTEAIVSRETLRVDTGDERLWDMASGGVEIPQGIARTVERLWSEATGELTAADEISFARALSDLDHKNDWIGIRRDVEALSTLFAVDQVEPPLSVAIFGDWGSGKTFLMEKIQERVEILEGVGRKRSTTLPDDEQPHYCSSILQIKFNAWHYTESNLWASLVNHIFAQLAEKLTPEDEEEPDHVEKFFEAFEVARAARRAAAKEVSLISAEVDEARDAVEADDKLLDGARRALGDAVGRSVWSFLDQELGQGGDQVKGLRGALQHFGFNKDLESAQTVYDTVQQYRTVGGRAREVFGSLLATRGGMIGLVAVAIVIAIATTVAAIFKVPIVTIGAAISASLAWLAERAQSAREHLAAIESFDEWFSELKQTQESQIAASIAEAQAALEERREALALARQHLIDAKGREARAQADLKQLTARDQMRRFVDERVTSQAYAQHLGIISMIRQDFENLSDFMYRDRQPGEARLVERVSETVQEAIPTIDRIILYIDDLDRCRPERVVEVLEAIHLLLAFRLFIVVVAVDPRWVIESLRQRYPHLSSLQPTEETDEPMPAQNGSVGQIRLEATAHDYLEKIFHIPFWVKPIEPNASKSLIAGYFGFSESAFGIEEEMPQLVEERFHDLVPVATAQESSVGTRIPERSSADTTADAAPAAGSYTEETFKRLDRERAKAERRVEHVQILDKEKEFIGQLAPYLGRSPRRIKRFANTYRLLKSGLRSQELATFATNYRGSDDYQIVLVFLAVITGAPSVAPDIFAKAFELRQSFTVGDLIQNCRLSRESCDLFEATNAKGALWLLRGTTVTPKQIEKWLPRVMRYAFRLTPVSLAEI